jgi:hypothetical protein
MTTPCAIRAAALWVALYGAHSVGPSLVESWMAAEGPAGAPALARLSVERRAAFKDLRYSTAPMRVACVVDGRNTSVLSARGCSATRTQKRTIYCLVRPRDVTTVEHFQLVGHKVLVGTWPADECLPSGGCRLRAEPDIFLLSVRQAHAIEEIVL